MDKVLNRYRAFWHKNPVDIPILGFTLATYTPLDMLDLSLLPTLGRLEPEDLDVSLFLNWYEQEWQKNRALIGDQFWVGVPFWGIPWIEAILGCPINITGKSIWAEHYLEDYRDYKDPDLSVRNPWLEKLLEFTVRLVEQSHGRFPVAPPLLRGPSDLITALRGPQRFLLDLYDYPDDVRRLAEQLAEVWVEVASQVLALIPPWHGGYCNGNRQIWAPGTCIETQEDAASMASPKIFRDFFSTGLRKIVGSFDYGWIHVHSSYHQNLPQLLDMSELAGIEFTIDTPPGPSVSELLPVMHMIQISKPLIVHGKFSLEEILTLIDNLSPSGFIIISRVDSIELVNKLEENISTHLFLNKEKK